MEKECFEFVSILMVELLSMDPLFTYDFMAAELHISKNTLSRIKQGRDMYLHNYLKVINYIMTTIRLKIHMPQLMKVLTQVLFHKCDLVVSAVPRNRGENYTPDKWVTVLEWETKE